MMIFFITYLLISLIISFFSFGKRISFIGTLLINLLLTPVIGIISVMKADNNIITHHYTNTSICAYCNVEVTNLGSLCPICGKEMEVTIIKDGKLGVA